MDKDLLLIRDGSEVYRFLKSIGEGSNFTFSVIFFGLVRLTLNK